MKTAEIMRAPPRRRASRSRGECLREMAALHGRVAELERALAAARRRAAASPGKKHSGQEEFLAMISHELRTPLHAIMGFAQLLRSCRGAEEKNQYAGYIVKGAEDLSAILNGILDYKDMCFEYPALEPGWINLPELLAEMDGLFHEKAKAKGLDWRLESAEGLPAKTRGRPGALRQTLLHLLDNAIKYTVRGGIRLRVRGEYRSGEDVWLIEFKVADTGAGMAPEETERVFQPFYKANTELNRKYSGVGLGLAMSRRLAGSMGGRLSCESESGKGSVFTLSLRCRAAVTARP